MSSFASSLRPWEKRLLAFIGLVVFAVFNVWYVFPTFKDWANVQNKIAELQKKKATYQSEIDKLPMYKKKLAEIRGSEDEIEIPKGDQMIDFRRRVETLAQSGNVAIQDMVGPNKSGTTATNQFFEEWNLSMRVISGEKDLVEFLYNLSSGRSSIRVRDLTLSPGQTTNLAASVVLVANYQKSTTTPAASPSASAPKIAPKKP